MNPQPHATPNVDAETITATILTAVERQFTRYFAAMSREADAARESADASRAEFAARLPLLEAAIDAQRVANEAYQQALQTALEERLAEFANHQHWRMNDLEDKVAAIPTQGPGIDPEELIEIRQAVRDDIEHSFTAVTARLDGLDNVGRQLDEQSNALVQHVAEAAAALAQRMDDGDQRLALAVEEQFAAAQAGLSDTIGEIETQVGEHTNVLLQKLESSDSRVTDRMLSLEARINDEQGTKLANLEAAMGRLGAGFDDALVAISQRVLGMENGLLALGDRIDALVVEVSNIDQDGIDELKSQMSNAVGEAMLVRIELDRMVASTDEKLDRQAVRLAEIEGLLTDQMDVGTAVQLERLEELERAVAMLDPSKFALQTGPITGSVPRMPLPILTLNPRLQGADSTPQVDASQEHDSTYSSF